jgi:hypothetical protein
MALAPDPTAALLLPLARDPSRRTRRNRDILPRLPAPRIAADPAVTPMPGLPDRWSRARRRRRNEFGHWRRRRHRRGRYDRRRRLLHDDLRGSGWGRGFAGRETQHGGHDQQRAANEAHRFTPSAVRNERWPAASLSCASAPQPTHNRRWPAAPNDRAPTLPEPAGPAHNGRHPRSS